MQEEKPTKTKHITRYSYPKQAFNGYRVCITKSGTCLTKYISDREAGSKEEAERIAHKLHELIVEQLTNAADKRACLTKFASMPKSDIIALR